MSSSAAWQASRAAGLVSFALLWASVIWGLLASSRPFSTGVSRAAIVDWHRILSTVALTFAGLHAAVLMLDTHAGYGIIDLVLPFAAEDSPLATAMGVVAFELGIAVAVSFRFRKHLGMRTWRALHMVAYPVFVLALAHFIAIGTDAKKPFVLGLALLSGFSVVFATAFRVIFRAENQRSQRVTSAAAAAGDAG